MPKKLTPKAKLTMEGLLEKSPIEPLETGSLVEAKVLSITKNEAWLDLGPFGAGYVGKREINLALELKAGDTVSASVLEPESVYGFPILSLKKVSKEKGWDRLQQLFEEQEITTIYPYDANRGGLLIELEGIRGFLPVSQLSTEHYPRVTNADKDEILQRLHALVKQPLKVRVLDLDRDQSKLIVSEKEAVKEDTKQRLAKIKEGDVVEGEVTGSVEFGVFVTVGGIEGLIHISELSWERVANPQELYHIGDKVKAKVIAIDNDKLSLSVKQLSEDPWQKEVKKLKIGDKVKGTITRITPFGAFVQISPAVEALVHISELEETGAKDKFVVGSNYEFQVLEVDPASRKITLSGKHTGKASTKSASTKKAGKSKT